MKRGCTALVELIGAAATVAAWPARGTGRMSVSSGRRRQRRRRVHSRGRARSCCSPLAWIRLLTMQAGTNKQNSLCSDQRRAERCVRRATGALRAPAPCSLLGEMAEEARERCVRSRLCAAGARSSLHAWPLPTRQTMMQGTSEVQQATQRLQEPVRRHAKLGIGRRSGRSGAGTPHRIRSCSQLNLPCCMWGYTQDGPHAFFSYFGPPVPHYSESPSWFSFGAARVAATTAAAANPTRQTSCKASLGQVLSSNLA